MRGCLYLSKFSRLVFLLLLLFRDSICICIFYINIKHKNAAISDCICQLFVPTAILLPLVIPFIQRI